MRQQTIPSVSIIICTHNGERTLLQCLEGLNKLVYRGKEVELLIIDNDSTDNTKKIAKEFIKKSKFQCLYVFEPEQGLSVARNRGIKEAKNEIVAFIDDDATADKEWLSYLVKSYDNPKVGCVGGKVLLPKVINLPNWLPKESLGYLGIFDYGNKRAVLPSDIHPIGCNISFKKKALIGIEGFKHNIGRRGESLLSGEETEACQKIRQAGYQIIYEPKAKVYHWLREERLTKKFLIRRYFMEGVSRASLEPVLLKEVLFFLPLGVIVQIIRILSKRKLVHFLNTCLFFGMLMEKIKILLSNFFNKS